MSGDTGFPIRDLSAEYSLSNDPIQTMLAPYIKEAVVSVCGTYFRFRYVDLVDAYLLLKRVGEKR